MRPYLPKAAQAGSLPRSPDATVHDLCHIRTSPGHEGVSGGYAHGRLTVSLLKEHSVRGLRECGDIRRVHISVPVRCELRAQVVNQNIQDVFRGGGRLCRPRRGRSRWERPDIAAALGSGKDRTIFALNGERSAHNYAILIIVFVSHAEFVPKVIPLVTSAARLTVREVGIVCPARAAASGRRGATVLRELCGFHNREASILHGLDCFRTNAGRRQHVRAWICSRKDNLVHDSISNKSIPVQ